MSKDDIEGMNLLGVSVETLSLNKFQTEQIFREALSSILKKNRQEPCLLLIQCNNAGEKMNLIACAQYICKEIIVSLPQDMQLPVHVLFILQLNHSKASFRVKLYILSFFFDFWYMLQN